MRTVFSIAVAITVALGVTSFAVADPPAGIKYAVLVGVNSYEHDRLPKLKYAVNDVSELSAVLTRGGYIVAVLSDSAGEKNESVTPTKANIDRILKGVLNGCKKNDTLLIA